MDVDWEEPTGGWQETVKEKCSSYCESLNWDNLGTPVCEDEHWNPVEPWDPLVPCTPPTPLLDLEKIEDVLGSTAAEEAQSLACDLADTCIDLLDFDAMHAMLTPATPLVRFSADVLMTTQLARVSSTMILGENADLIGEAAYTAYDCAEDACPFYLAQFDLKATDDVDIVVEWSKKENKKPKEIDKTLNDISLSLARPALGLWLPNSGDIIFPSDSLAIRVNVTVSGPNNKFGANGSYENVYRLEDYVFGTLDGVTLNLSHEGVDLLGTWSVESHFVPE